MIIGRRARVVISFPDGRRDDRCEGPTAEGSCPRAGRDGRLACAGGRLLPLRGTSADGVRIDVGREDGPCPLAGLVHVTGAPWDQNSAEEAMT